MVPAIGIVVLIISLNQAFGQSCNHDGELLPNMENCRKYYKCSNGQPSPQSCPGTLIFDTILKICNWPESTTCVADILKPSSPSREEEEEGEEKEEKKPVDPERQAAIASLFHVRDREKNPLLRLRTRHRPQSSRTTSPPRQRININTIPSRGSQFISSDDSNSEESVPGENSENSAFNRLREEAAAEVEAIAPVVKPKHKFEPVRCHTGASNELYANPQNCRKYFKCENGGASLQSCPANLVFDSNLKICNWPDSTTCLEDPDAELPELSSSDRHPPKSRKPSINIIDSSPDAVDDFEDRRHPEEEESPLQSLPFPEHGSPPTEREALERELLLTKQYPLFDKVKETVHSLDTKLVEKITPGDNRNPDNVQRVEFILTEENYEDLFPRRHPSYTYQRLLQAIGKFPAICSYLGTEEKSDKICRKILATMFAHFTQETGNHNPSDEIEEWRQGLSVVRELGCTDTSPGCGYNSNCEDKDSITKKWACGKDAKGTWKKYYGRGAKQLSYNFNYGQFSQAMFGDGRLLLDFPDVVASTWLNLASATWFLTTPQPPKPSMLHVIDGTWVPNKVDKQNGIAPGFGATINIINGGLECNTKDGRESNQALNRIAYYKQFAWYLYVDLEGEELGCANQKQFSAGGAGALPIYWDKDWSAPFSCKLVNYQTAHSALAPGEYIDCVEENFNISVRGRK